MIAFPTWITLCETCKRSGWEDSGSEVTDGARLAALVEARLPPGGHVRSRRVACTMGCERACNVIVQARGKIGYSLGLFEPDEAAAGAIAAYAGQHAASETGRVPFREWPKGVRGHFVSRHMPLPDGEDMP